MLRTLWDLEVGLCSPIPREIERALLGSWTDSSITLPFLTGWEWHFRAKIPSVRWVDSLVKSEESSFWLMTVGTVLPFFPRYTIVGGQERGPLINVDWWRNGERCSCQPVLLSIQSFVGPTFLPDWGRMSRQGVSLSGPSFVPVCPPTWTKGFVVTPGRCRNWSEEPFFRSI